MASSVWNSVQVPTGGMISVVSTAGGDPASMLNTQLANALSTMGDSQYWEESISPSTIRTSLATTDPSHAHATPTLLRAMKWLLASISKGRNVSDFYPHVVKLVGVPSLEVRKMVYMYLIQYSDHDATTRELSLLSINSFQRGLADNEALIRALALRVLTSIRVPDILQIQILGVQKCASDRSPYVRKCAANALAKLYDQCAADVQQQTMLLDIMQQLLDDDDQTMVLTSAVIAFSDLCPQKLELLHGCFRKLCNLIADMDEWGQIIVIDVLTRYCRQFFEAPRGTGSAEAIDAERRVVRTLQASGLPSSNTSSAAGLDALVSMTNGSEHSSTAMPARIGPRKIKRRVVKKGFYSDEEDGSTEEEVYAASLSGTSLPVATAMRERSLATPQGSTPNAGPNDLEDEHLDDDHRLLLRTTLPLLKSRNTGVVLAVCSLHYYCGVASIRVRSSLGRALVRIHRDRREIQYAVLTSIHSLVKECPSAFTPFLHDFYVKAMDPSFTRLLKLDILTLLALEPASIESVLKELRTYIRHDDDKIFCCASIRAVGKVAELARIVHDRHAENKSGNVARERKEANRVALNALYGLLTLTRASTDGLVVGECAIVMERILLQLLSNGDGEMAVEDPNRIQEQAVKKLLLLLIGSLASRSSEKDDGKKDDDDDEEDDDELSKFVVPIPPLATASTLWIVGEWLAPSSTFTLTIPNFNNQARNQTRLELIRLIARAYPVLEPVEKLQSIHFSSKLLVSSASPKEAALCEHVLSLGRTEVQHDVRDRARMESNMLHTSRGLQYDADNLAVAVSGKTLAVGQVQKVLLSSRPPSSSLPLLDEEEVDGDAFRFGTLSSLVGRKAKSAYLPLPKWASTNSPSSLRDEKKTEKKSNDTKSDNWKVDTNKKAASGFYESDDSTDEDDSSGDSSDSDGSDDEEEDSSEWDSDDESDDDDDEDSDDSDDSDDIATPQPTMSSTPQPVMNQPSLIDFTPTMVNGAAGTSRPPIQVKTVALVDEESDDDSSDDDSSEWDEDSDDSDDNKSPAVAQGIVTSNLLDMSQPQAAVGANLLGMMQPQPVAAQPAARQQPQPAKSNGSYADGLAGLVMAPVVVNVEEKVDPDIDRDSSAWMDFVRHELGGGLSVQARYLRGPTRDREARLIGLDPSSPTVVLYQLQFQNKRTDRGVLRRVRIVARSTSSGHVAPTKTVIPPEIVALAKGQMAVAILGVTFASVSDREGSLQARFDLKSDRATTALDLRPPLGELVQPLKMTADAFEKGMKQLQGFQRVTSKFTVASVESLGGAVLKQVALQPLDSKADTWGKSRQLRLVGCLPASTDKLYIEVQCKDDKSGTFTVCCDNAMATNSILDTLKKALKS